jgi:hypothetical protein
MNQYKQLSVGLKFCSELYFTQLVGISRRPVKSIGYRNKSKESRNFQSENGSNRNCWIVEQYRYRYLYCVVIKNKHSRPDQIRAPDIRCLSVRWPLPDMCCVWLGRPRTRTLPPPGPRAAAARCSGCWHSAAGQTPTRHEPGPSRNMNQCCQTPSQTFRPDKTSVADPGCFIPDPDP